jgi:hypothetical protein
MEDRIVARFRKSAMEEIVMAVRTYEGSEFVDIRTFFGPRGQETRPTKKGITIPFEHYREFRKQIDLLDSVVAELGWT